MEIKSKRESLEGVLKDNIACWESIKVRTPSSFCAAASTVHPHPSVFQDYETDLAAYTSGLETLLNIPIKRTMLKSPTVDLNQEVSDLKKKQFACKNSYFFHLTVSGYSTANSLHGASHHVCRLLPIPGRPAQKHGGAQGISVAAFFEIWMRKTSLM